MNIKREVVKLGLIISIIIIVIAFNYKTESKEVVISPEPLVPLKVEIVLPKVMQNIAKCESGNEQFNKDGSVKRGVINPRDVGKFQINEIYHLGKAKELGIDIYTAEGNTEYAMYLYKNEGTTPWDWSKPCWSAL